MFANLFKRAEASVDNAIGDLGNRVLIAIPFLVAVGFAAASLSMIANRTYGAETGNFILAVGFAVLGCLIAIVVKLRSSPLPEIDEASDSGNEKVASAQSIFDNEQLMGVVSAAAPVLLPALLRTATKNWPLILAVAAGLYVFTFSEDAGHPPTQQPLA